MTDIWLVRHGEAAAGFGEDIDPGLSPLGHQQAETAEKLLTPVVPEGAILLSSPKRRALETGGPFAGSRGQDLLSDSCFIELPSPGNLDERHAWIQQVLRAQWNDLPESVSVWRAEIFRALQACTGPTVIFTHFLVINSVESKISGDNTVLQCLPGNGSVHHLRINGDDWRWMSRGEMLESVIN
jgi:broad specificity phosphatase PhoE